MAATRLGLYELLAPQFLLGFTFPEYVDRYLSVLGVDELHTAWDETATVYTGRVTFTGDAGAEPVREHRDPSGAVFEWEDVSVEFRLTVPRDGAAVIDTAITSPSLPSTVATALQPLDALFDRFGAVEQTATAPTEYPGLRFRLELMVTALTFHMGKSWLPGEVGANHRIVAMDKSLPTTPDDVRFVLPKVVLAYEQGDDLGTAPTFEVKSWGSSGFDAPSDLAMGEVVRMEPEIALHESGRIAFGVGPVVLDLSEDHTPPEILQFFGVDEAWKGIYVKSLQFYYADSDKSLGFNFGIRDALISFAGEVSLEGRLDILGPETEMDFDVRFYSGARRIDYTRGRAVAGGSPRSIKGGAADVTDDTVVHVLVRGGAPPVTVSVKLDGAEIWDATTRTARIPAGTTGTKALVVSAQDAAATPRTYDETIELTVKPAAVPSVPSGLPADRPATEGDLPKAVLTPGGAPPAGYGLSHVPASSGITETVVVQGPPGATYVLGTAAARPVKNGRIAVDVPEGSATSPLALTVTWPAVAAPPPETFLLYFSKGRPDPEASETLFAQIKARYVADDELPRDARFEGSRAPNGGTLAGPAALRSWASTRLLPGTPITITGHASYEDDLQATRDRRLSDRRQAIARAIVAASGATGTVSVPATQGHQEAKDARRPDSEVDRVARISGQAVATPSPAVTVAATIGRAARPAPSTTAPVVPAPAPPPPADEPPSTFRRLSFRVRLERNVPVLMEVSGELDFETEMEEELRANTPASGSAPSGSSGDLQLKQTTAASTNPNPADGIVDFTLTVTYDPASHALTERLALGASPDDINGLLRMENPRTAGTTTATNRVKDAFGALLVLAPVINSAASAIDDGSAGEWALLTVSVAVPAAIGAIGVFKTQTVTLYGGELRFRQFVPPGESLTFTDAGVVFDYGVEFGIEIEQLGIATTKPLKVRYRAVGFNLNFEGGLTYQPIFDTSKGYDIDLSDPGLFKLPAPLGDVVKILAARISRTNPLTLEVDLGLKVDLGVVTVDRFRVKWPLDPLGIPSILPTGAKVDIPGAVVGSGFVNIIEPPGPGAPPDAISAAGFEGMLDVSLVPIKLRICASLGVRHLKDPARNREAIAVFFGLIVDFPAPIPILQSGIGIYGFSGLFAMHYKRLEDPAVPGDAVGPALRWLVKAQGEPAKLAAGSPPVTVWGPEFDRWSFGVGAKLGTMEGGFLANLRGMLVVELPGPRILIFVKIEIVAPIGDLKPATNLIIGILGVVDLDFNLWTLTVGIIVDLEVEEIVQIQIPVELFFKLQAPWPWHLYIGTFQSKASAMVLNLVRAWGYFMISGESINGWPGYAPTQNLPPIAVATGIGASITLGDESIGLYLKVAARADLGISFFPKKMYMIGKLRLDGELRIFIVSVEAHGKLDVEAPDPTYIQGEICGKVDFFFFSVSGCVGLEIGSNVRSLPAPDLVTSVFMQSHAPVLTAGQADRPIDASLGDAFRIPTPGGAIPPPTSDPATDPVPTVPIDTVPVVQLHASPLAVGATTFTKPLVASPRETPGGWIDVGGGRKVKYVLKEVSLTPPLPTTAGLPPATWRTETSPSQVSGAKTNIDLALMSRVPVQGERAMERSSELTESVTLRWEHACEPVAPAVCVLWTFCGEPIGPSGEGWELEGTPQPDPPGTTRTTPAPTTLLVEEPAPASVDELLDKLAGPAGAGAGQPAKVVGPGSGRPGEPGGGTGGPGQPVGELVCVHYRRFDTGAGDNPRTDLGVVVEVRDHTGARAAETRIVEWGSQRGLDVGFRTVISFPAGTRAVELVLVTFSHPARVTATNADGTTSSASMTVGQQTPDRIRLTGSSIVRVAIDAPQDETLLLALCAEAQPRRAIERVGERRGLLPTGDARRDRLAEGVLRTLRERDAREAAAVERLEVDVRRHGTLAAGLPVPEASSPFGALATGLGDALGGLPTRPFRPIASVGPVGPVAPVGPALPLAGTATNLDAECFRALQLPASTRGPAKPVFKASAKGSAWLKKRDLQSWITLHTGRATQVRLLLAVGDPSPGLNGVVLRQLDGAGAVLVEDRLDALGPTSVTGTTGGLPAEWTDPAGPWAASVVPVATFLADDEFAGLQRWVVTVKPRAETERIQVAVLRRGRTVVVPEVLVGVVEVCPIAEEERVATEEAIRAGQIETLTGYLDGDTPVPLLQPGTTYRLRIGYDAVTQPASGAATTEPRVQEFGFRTDAKAPPRLDPWVLGTTPNDLDHFVFWRDPVKVVFNDLAILQLYQAYGKQLRVKLIAADGVPVPHQEITALDPTDADFWSPYRDVLEGLIGAGLLPCTGSSTFPHHGTWTSGIELRPTMAYTLDVAVEPADPAPTGAAANRPIVPLYRRSFATSRFPDLASLVADVQGRTVRHRFLNAQLAGLPTTGDPVVPPAPAPATTTATATDQAIQAALVAAGEQALPAPETSGIVVYWAKRAGASTFSPHAVLIDAAEPLWRSRDEPRLETVPGQTDPAYQRVVPGRAPGLEVIENGTTGVARFIRSPSGTRTLAIVKDTFTPGGGVSIRLAVRRPASSLYGLSGLSFGLIDLPFGAKAPWEEDE